jgi:hypothetical protein
MGEEDVAIAPLQPEFDRAEGRPQAHAGVVVAVDRRLKAGGRVCIGAGAVDAVCRRAVSDALEDAFAAEFLRFYSPVGAETEILWGSAERGRKRPAAISSTSMAPMLPTSVGCGPSLQMRSNAPLPPSSR